MKKYFIFIVACTFFAGVMYAAEKKGFPPLVEITDEERPMDPAAKLKNALAVATQRFAGESGLCREFLGTDFYAQNYPTLEGLKASRESLPDMGESIAETLLTLQSKWQEYVRKNFDTWMKKYFARTDPYQISLSPKDRGVTRALMDIHLSENAFIELVMSLELERQTRELYEQRYRGCDADEVGLADDDSDSESSTGW